VLGVFTAKALVDRSVSRTSRGRGKVGHVHRHEIAQGAMLTVCA